MNLLFYFLLSFVISITAVNAQRENSENYLINGLPTGLTLNKSVARS
jgi:hypothetical protein